jgi:hypothetical protein
MKSLIFVSLVSLMALTIVFLATKDSIHQDRIPAPSASNLKDRLVQQVRADIEDYHQASDNVSCEHGEETAAAEDAALRDAMLDLLMSAPTKSAEHIEEIFALGASWRAHVYDSGHDYRLVSIEASQRCLGLGSHSLPMYHAYVMNSSGEWRNVGYWVDADVIWISHQWILLANMRVFDYGRSQYSLDIIERQGGDWIRTPYFTMDNADSPELRYIPKYGNITLSYSTVSLNEPCELSATLEFYSAHHDITRTWKPAHQSWMVKDEITWIVVRKEPDSDSIPLYNWRGFCIEY